MSGREKPHFAGTVLGVREWLTNPALMHLEPVTKVRRWNEDGPTKARCGSVIRFHRVPGRHCECGLYAFHPWSHQGRRLRTRCDPYESIAGVIEAWGRIELHEEGFWGSIEGWLEGRDGALSQEMVESLLPIGAWHEKNRRARERQERNRQREEKIGRLLETPPGRAVAAATSLIGRAIIVLMGILIFGPAIAVLVLIQVVIYGSIILGILGVLGIDPLGLSGQ